MKNPTVQERTRLHFARIVIEATAPECLPDSQDVRQFMDAKPAAIEVLIQALSSKDKCCREGAAFALSLCAPEAVAAIPALKAALADPEEMVSEAVAAALKRIQGTKDEAQR